MSLMDGSEFSFSSGRAVPGDVLPIVHGGHCHSDLHWGKALSERAERAKRNVALLPCARLRRKLEPFVGLD